ncbi:Chemoreceptor glutamine deamidase CheD [Limihaloglobus sulfuriphilus]|uniref:Probable chemoreceptor glutamine deamidase CheD n=1 Tax=Limihaloglobus sulfuriphilus TaxID=1851148 RepID=A0A1Q2MC13_9BACT|nr:chemotaxis protein CheD [Limihaloglobus sulfuriphilus]AQQ69782.1 Chemoreceptor glutamine deamidase CheD [Limihaloglobus sulfuriphilus]
MQNIIDVNTGDVKVSCGGEVLRSLALGSCIAVVAYDPASGAGGIAHIMLPGMAPENARLSGTFYAEDAISNMLELFSEAGTDTGNLEVFLVGAANVLKRHDDTICEANINSVLKIMDEKGINVVSSFLGGTERKRVYLDTSSGSVFCSQGDDSDMITLRGPGQNADFVSYI